MFLPQLKGVKIVLLLDMENVKKKYVSVVFPLALPGVLTYEIGEDLVDSIKFGMQVEVPLKNKLYSAVVVAFSDQFTEEYRPRKVVSIIDNIPVIDPLQFQFWKWIASYYACTIGEVMGVAMPSGLKLTSETKLSLSEDNDLDYSELSNNEFMLADVLMNRKELSIGEVESILNKKSVYPEIRALLDMGIVKVGEELIQKYKPRFEKFIGLSGYYEEDRDRLTEALDLVSRSEKQKNAILGFLHLAKSVHSVSKSELIDWSGTDGSTIKALVNKEIFIEEKKRISRIHQEQLPINQLPEMSELQKNVHSEIRKMWELKSTVLLHGVTGSGKTRVFMEIIQEELDKGNQVLYLLPEIALTAQIVQRLLNVFGNKVFVYHSRMNNHERVELWKAALQEAPIIIGARSSLFLPYKKLGAIIVDEEHDSSYKQQDPSPRYNARDAAIFLAQSYGAKVLLGSATPSLESYYNAQLGKYGKVEMMERFGDVALPEITIVDLRKERKHKRLISHFSKELRDSIDQALVNGKQALIFQNRRGYSPSVQCANCGWIGQCKNCDITLTKHKYFGELRCHYCGYRENLHQNCPDCGSDELIEIGFGTEKIENIIADLFPLAKVSRLDYDTTRSKSAYEKIIADFAAQKVDILVGTQMITKGLDFDNIAVVGVLNADLLLFFPDFRASERAFQLLTQVAGRAGRRKEQGKVIIQTSKPTHPVLIDVIGYNYHKLIHREAYERKQFIYPPYFRMVNITLKHKDVKKVHEAAEIMGMELKAVMGKRVIGPAEPGVARLRGLYLRMITIKLEKDNTYIAQAKATILKVKKYVKEHKGLKSVRINIDVDPY